MMMLDLRTAFKAKGGVQKVARQLDVTAATVYRWINEGSLPPERAAVLAEMWGVHKWQLHDPWIGTRWRAEEMTRAETLEELKL